MRPHTHTERRLPHCAACANRMLCSTVQYCASVCQHETHVFGWMNVCCVECTPSAWFKQKLVFWGVSLFETHAPFCLLGHPERILSLTPKGPYFCFLCGFLTKKIQSLGAQFPKYECLEPPRASNNEVKKTLPCLGKSYVFGFSVNTAGFLSK